MVFVRCGFLPAALIDAGAVGHVGQGSQDAFPIKSYLLNKAVWLAKQKQILAISKCTWTDSTKIRKQGKSKN